MSFARDPRTLSGGTLTLEAEEIEQLLPHRSPMLLLDRIIAMIPGDHAVGVKMVTGNEFGLARRRRPFVFPATFTIEALGQLAAVTLLYGREPQEAPSVLLVGIERLTVHRELLGGEPIHLSITVVRRRGPLVVIDGHATLHGEPYVDATFQLKVET